MSANKNETKYATTGTNKEFWSVWIEENIEWLNNKISHLLTTIPTPQDKDIISIFDKERFIDIFKNFILFDKKVKKIARYQQFFAVYEIIKTINTFNNGKRESGVIWHTQGSGKSLTMVMVAKYILNTLKKSNPKIIIVTDRIQLDKQINETFCNTKIKANRAYSGANLLSLINNNSADVITTIVNKFKFVSNNNNINNSSDIFILVDESHRTHYGEFNQKMKEVFPNACYLAFTGTPLMKSEKNTMIKFGKIIHKYTISDAIRDKEVVPLLYEGRMIEQSINQKAIDLQLEIITRNLNEKQKEEVIKKWSQFEKIASSEQRIKLIAFDVSQHFKNNYKTTSCQYKAIFAVNSKIEAVKYLKAFEEINEITAKVIISPPDEREGYDVVGEESKDVVINFWNKLIKDYKDAEDYEDSVKNEYLNGDDIDLLIVVDKLLTGFDAPKATVLYIDKPMKEHTLLQAIARVNRVYEGKDYGIIIDYRGLLTKLDEALQIYSSAGFENFDESDLSDVLKDVVSIVSTIRTLYTDLKTVFISINDNDIDYIEKCEILLENEEIREFFYNLLSNFSRNVAIAIESDRVYKALKKGELEIYKKDLKFYQELRKSIKIRYSDSLDNKEYESKMQKLIDNYISAEEVIHITNPINIFDELKFQEELNRMNTDRGKADAIRTRITKTISIKMNENPVFFKSFSKRIDEVLEDYKKQRISEKEYLEKMEKIINEFRKENKDTESYPQKINNNIHAKVFYEVAKDIILEKAKRLIPDDILAEIAIKIHEIIKSHIQIDWKTNNDIHNKIKSEIDDLLFFYHNEYLFGFDVSDKVIEAVLLIAMNRY